VLALAADTIGDHVAALPDGETGYRANWINFQAYFVHHAHPDVETLQRPEPVDGVLQWSPSGFHNNWNFRLRDGVEKISYDTLYYAEVARRSYIAFRDLREAGRIPDGVRFQVCLPTPTGGISAHFREDGRDYHRVLPGYAEAMRREVARIVEAIPAEDLAIQWDVCNEVLDLEGVLAWMPDDRAWDRYLETLRAIASVVPAEALLGYHLCYGDLGGKHIAEPADLALVTRMANAAVAETPRPVDWLHMPVPADRDDDAYFAPLADLEAPDSRLFLGLIHAQDGVEGARRRLAAARRHAPVELGASTWCGFGRMTADAVRPLLELHRGVAEELFADVPAGR
jgi:methionine synthase II (cobalamin-independent)